MTGGREGKEEGGESCFVDLEPLAKHTFSSSCSNTLKCYFCHLLVLKKKKSALSRQNRCAKPCLHLVQ